MEPEVRPRCAGEGLESYSRSKTSSRGRKRARERRTGHFKGALARGSAINRRGVTNQWKKAGEIKSRLVPKKRELLLVEMPKKRALKGISTESVSKLWRIGI